MSQTNSGGWFGDALDAALQYQKLRTDERLARAEIQQQAARETVYRDSNVNATTGAAAFNASADFVRAYQPWIIGGFAALGLLGLALLARGR